jgi:alanyl-tRNA synthetase
MNSRELRASYISFFHDLGHRVVESSPVMPQGDPTLLFTNAGMNQFKDVLLGNEIRDYRRATNAQKCIRAGGKHNDLDEVGKDGRHLTFFEMLGNWSFGDYYKKEAIEWAWTYIRDVLKLDMSRVYVTVYKDDDDAYSIWTDQIGVPAERVLRLGDIDQGDEENFWSMGPTGPCGPCTELMYDMQGDTGPPLTFEPGFDEDRLIEFWNLVFMAHDRDDKGNLSPLAMKSVDTGLGLDRMAMILAGRDNVFQTDLFCDIFRATLEALGETFDGWEAFYARPDFTDYAVIADHIRTVTFSLCDGATFSNEGRGYVVRRILRRAVRHGRRLGFTGPFLHQVCQGVVTTFGDIYPEVAAMGAKAAQLIRMEEERFFRNLDRGIELFEETAVRIEGSGGTKLEGQDVFRLHTTFGFPPDLTEIMAQERQLEIDWPGYQALWTEHQKTSKGKDIYAELAEAGDWSTCVEGETSSFVGYSKDECKTRAMKWRRLDAASYEVLLEQTPFYAESGGQVGDTGELSFEENGTRVAVVDTQRTPLGIVHKITWDERDPNRVAEVLASPVIARIDRDKRRRTEANHTGTHLLHAALRTIVSSEIFQAGSHVAPERLRFDFSCPKPVTDAELLEIENWVNDRIGDALEVSIHSDVERERAVNELGAMAIFGEKYGARVRVVQIPHHSVELCGGNHVANTAKIRRFRIVSESGVSAGTRRIEAITTQTALTAYDEDRRQLKDIARILKTDTHNLVDRARSVVAERGSLEKEVQRLSQQIAAENTAGILADAEEVEGIRVIAQRIEVTKRGDMLTYADQLRSTLDQGVVLLASEIDGKAALLCLVTDPVVAKGLRAGDLIKEAATFVDGRGGGKPTLAQAGGNDPTGIDRCVQSFKQIVARGLSSQ